MAVVKKGMRITVTAHTLCRLCGFYSVEDIYSCFVLLTYLFVTARHTCCCSHFADGIAGCGTFV